MDWWEILLITVGISLDIFAAVECQGALAARVQKRELIVVGITIAAWQMGALFLGSYFAHLLYTHRTEDRLLVMVLVVVILICLGIRMICKAVKNEGMIEHREDGINFKRFVRLAAVTSAYTVLAGAVLGFMGSSMLQILLMIAVVTFAVVILGMYTGYHFGFEQKTKAYVIGGLLLIIAGMDVIIKQFVL